MALISHRPLLAASAFSGAVMTHFLLFRELPFPAAFEWDTFDGCWVTVGAIAGAVLGHLGWVAVNPRQRISRAAAVCALVNLAVWAAFVAFTPPVEDSEFAQVAAQREPLHADSGQLEIIHDAPTIVAGRWHGTFGAVNFPDRLLSLVDPGAIPFAQLLVIPPRHLASGATRAESFVVGGLAFLLSTAFCGLAWRSDFGATEIPTDGVKTQRAAPREAGLRPGTLARDRVANVGVVDDVRRARVSTMIVGRGRATDGDVL